MLVRTKLIGSTLLTIASLFVVLVGFFIFLELDAQNENQVSTALKIRESQVELSLIENEFLLTHREDLITLFAEKYQEMSKDVNSVIDISKDEQVDSYSTELLSLISQHASSFENLVSIMKEIGLTPETGLYGNLRTAARELEAALADNNDAHVLLLTLRRNEKDFMLRRTVEYMNNFNKYYHQLKQHLQEDGDAKSYQKLDVYAENFNALAKMRIPAKLNSHSGQREHPDP